MSEQPKSAGEQWLELAAVNYMGRLYAIAEACDPAWDDDHFPPYEELNARIVLNAEKARLFDLLAAKDWRFLQHGPIQNPIYDVVDFDEIVVGSGATPLEAAQNAEKRLKGGA